MIGPRRALKRKLRAVRADLDRAHGIAHHLNDQLTVMLGRTELLARTAGNGDGNAAELHRAAKQAALLAHELLALWATEAPPLTDGRPAADAVAASRERVPARTRPAT